MVFQKDEPIILLDEATASVDPDNEEQIQLAISELVHDKTLVVIAHKLSTIKNYSALWIGVKLLENDQAIMDLVLETVGKETGQKINNLINNKDGAIIAANSKFMRILPFGTE